MIKEIVRYGSSLVIVFHKAEQRLYGIEEGQVYDIEMALKNKSDLKKAIGGK